jgi:N-acetylgalactosamine kinase
MMDLASFEQNPGVLDAFYEKHYFYRKNSKAVESRYRTLSRCFRNRFGGSHARIARAPGRVNLLGEHTDYNGAPVLPMALDRDIAAFFYPRTDSRIVISNAREKYGEREFSAESEIPPYQTGDWGNYAKAAVQGLTKSFPRETYTGFDMAIDATLPAAGGLSSSSALVVLCGLVFTNVNKLPISKMELADIMAGAEKYVGTQGGGMDQAASLLSVSGCALKIDFNPLRTRPVPLPEGYVFAVAHSTVSAPKTELVMDSYNSRSASCRMAADIISRHLVSMGTKKKDISLIGDLTEEKTNMPEPAIRKEAEGVLGKEGWTLKRAASFLRIPIQEARDRYLLRKDGTFMQEPAHGFPLLKRFRHVYEEWHRVEKAALVLERGDAEEFGKLMNSSHYSCRDLFEISCKELDVLTETALKKGSLGSRLSGAGFGGCTVNLVPAGKMREFIESLKDDYYRGYLGVIGDLSHLVFPCKAAGGAEIPRVK